LDVPRGRRLAAILVLAAVYTATARLGLALDAVAGFATLVWPPTGIALAALLRVGRWTWPGIALGAFAVNLWVGGSPAVAAGIAAGNTLEALVAAEGLRLAGFDPRLQRPVDVLKLAAIGALGSTLLSATLGVGSLYAGGVVTAARFGFTWRAWWMGDGMGDLVVAPLLLAVRSKAPAIPARRVRGEIGGLVLAVLVAALAVFGGVVPEPYGARVKYLLFVPLVWSAVRFGISGAALAVAAVSACAIGVTAGGHGPFAGPDLFQALLELQFFLAVMATVILVLGAVVTERDASRRAALAAVRARDDFISIAAHELRTPLSALLLQIGSLRQRLIAGTFASPAVLAERVGRAERQADRLSKLIENLFDVSRIEAGQLEIEPARMDLAEMLRDLVDRTREAAARAGCDLHLAVPGEAVRGEWDRLRLEQVVSNLLANAFRYAPGAPVEVTLEVRGDAVRVAVRDHGAPVPPARLAGIFARSGWAPAAGGGEARASGLGLGLYIARHVVEQHGGRVRASAEPDGGLRVSIDLPRVPVRPSP
jgi:signal transduction histidine kinase